MTATAVALLMSFVAHAVAAAPHALLLEFSAVVAVLVIMARRPTRKAPPVKLSQIRSEQKTIIVAFSIGDLKVTYRPNAFTADAADKINEASRDPQKQTDAMFEMVGGILVDWDLEDDKGRIIPLDEPARLRSEVPMGVFGRIFSEISADQNPQGAGKSPAPVA